MRYQGSKTKMKKTIREFVEGNIKKNQTYVEPFVGGCNSFSEINHPNKIGCDTNQYLIDMWEDIKKNNFNPPQNVSEELYYDIKNDCITNGDKYSNALKAYVGFACSYGSGWWNGYAHYNERKNEDHIKEAGNGLIKQIERFKNLSNSTFINCDYKTLELPNKSFIYCDPPYANTKQYANSFDNNEFWEWCRTKVNEGHTLLISEYNAPDDFICVWSKEMQDGMKSTNGKKVEKLFIHKSQIKHFKNINKNNLTLSYR